MKRSQHPGAPADDECRRGACELPSRPARLRRAGSCSGARHLYEVARLLDRASRRTHQQQDHQQGVQTPCGQREQRLTELACRPCHQPVQGCADTTARTSGSSRRPRQGGVQPPSGLRGEPLRQRMKRCNPSPLRPSTRRPATVLPCQSGTVSMMSPNASR